MNYLYIDESGDLGLRGSNYLVIVALQIDDFKPLDRILKNMRRNKFKKELSKSNEIKANKSSVEIIKHMLKELNKVKNTQIYCTFLNKSYVYNQSLINDKNKLYDYVAADLGRRIIVDGHVEVRIDKSKGKQLLRDEFDDCFRKNLVKGSHLSQIKIYHSYSHSWSGLQFADILAWSYFQKYERGNDFYVDKIEIDQTLSKVWDKGK